MAGQSLQVEPFGQPDGTLGEIREVAGGFIPLHARYGGISRSADDAKIRVLAGRLGAGKSLYLRRMSDAQAQQDSVFAADTSRNLSDLTTSDLALFARRVQSPGANTELWKKLWRRAIMRSAASYIVNEKSLTQTVPEEALDALRRWPILFGEPSAPRRPTNEAKEIIDVFRSSHQLREYLEDHRWADAEYYLSRALAETKPLFLYIDSIDDNYRWGPALWTQCQRGLFYAVMDLLREAAFQARLHVVVAIRDVTLASLRSSEHWPRYLDATHINILSWNRASMRELLSEKLDRLDESYFQQSDDRSVASWLGTDAVENKRTPSSDESTVEYLIRHTRLVPRDLVNLGNRLCAAIRENGYASLSAPQIRREVAASALEAVESQLSQCASQALSDLLPLEAIDGNWAHIYLEPNEYQLNEVQRWIKVAIASTETEVFGSSELERMNKVASEQFSDEVRLADILWQNSLLGVMGGERSSRFFSIDERHETTVPREPGCEYVWNPLLFDAVDGLRCVLTQPEWPW